MLVRTDEHHARRDSFDKGAKRVRINRSSASGSNAVARLKAAWVQKKREIFAGKLTKPDSEDPNIVNHLNWYEATGFTRAFPGENRVMHPSEFKISSAPRVADLDD